MNAVLFVVYPAADNGRKKKIGFTMVTVQQNVFQASPDSIGIKMADCLYSLSKIPYCKFLFSTFPEASSDDNPVD